MKTLKQEFKEAQDEIIQQAFNLASNILQQIAVTPDNLKKHVNERGQEALDIITQRYQPEFEQFYICQLDKYSFQSVFPSKLSELTQVHESLLDAYHYIHEKIGRVKIIIKMLEN
jgi:hypothetical protein